VKDQNTAVPESLLAYGAVVIIYEHTAPPQITRDWGKIVDKARLVVMWVCNILEGKVLL